MEREMRDRNEWFKEAKGALRHLEIEAVENPLRVADCHVRRGWGGCPVCTWASSVS